MAKAKAHARTPARREYERQYARRWRRKNRKRLRATQRAWRKKNVEKQVTYRLRCLYGITKEKRDAMHRGQRGRCALCRRKQRLVVDHCHRRKRRARAPLPALQRAPWMG